MDNTIIGQKTLLDTIDCYIKLRTFPRCSLFIGDTGSGRKTMAHEVAKRLKANCVVCGISIDNIRSAIKTAYSSYNKIVFVFPNIENMSNKAENALLKFLEEPPNNVYIVLTACSEDSVLSTIVSRCPVFKMGFYSPQEILMYYERIADNVINSSIVQQICETPGDVEEMVTFGVHEVWSYADLVVNNLATVTGANALKIGSKIAFKENEEGKIGLSLFFKAFKQLCIARIQEDICYARWIRTTNVYMQQLRIKGINKTMLFDNWVLDCRDDVFNA